MVLFIGLGARSGPATAAIGGRLGGSTAGRARGGRRLVWQSLRLFFFVLVLLGVAAATEDGLVCSKDTQSNVLLTRATAVTELLRSWSTLLDVFVSILDTTVVTGAAWAASSSRFDGELSVLAHAKGSLAHDVSVGRLAEVMLPYPVADRTLNDTCVVERLRQADDRFVALFNAHPPTATNCTTPVPTDNLTSLCAHLYDNVTCPELAALPVSPHAWINASQCPVQCLNPQAFNNSQTTFLYTILLLMRQPASAIHASLGVAESRLLYSDKALGVMMFPSLEENPGLTLAQIGALYLDSPRFTVPPSLVYGSPAYAGLLDDKKLWTPAWFSSVPWDSGYQMEVVRQVYSGNEWRGVASIQVPVAALFEGLQGNTTSENGFYVAVSDDGHVWEAPNALLSAEVCPRVPAACSAGGVYSHKLWFENVDTAPLHLQNASLDVLHDWIQTSPNVAYPGVDSQNMTLGGVAYHVARAVISNSNLRLYVFLFNPQSDFDHLVSWNIAPSALVMSSAAPSASCVLTNTGSRNVSFALATPYAPNRGTTVEPMSGSLAPGASVEIRAWLDSDILAKGGNVPESPVFSVTDPDDACRPELTLSVQSLTPVTSKTDTSFAFLLLIISSSVLLLIAIAVGARLLYNKYQDTVTVAKVAKRRLANEKDFVAFVFHELRNPLNGVVSYLQFMRIALQNDASDNDGSREDIRADCDNAMLSCSHMLDVLRNVLDLAKLTEGKLQLQMQPCNMPIVCESVVRMMRAMNHEVRLTTRVRGALPPAVLADDRRVRQIVINLVGNALKFTHQGTVQVNICNVTDLVDAYQRDFREAPFVDVDTAVEQGAHDESLDDSHVVIQVSVTDDGPGISVEKQQQLFRKFGQVSENKAELSAGTGLGLFISQKFVRLMGGSLSVKSPWRADSSSGTAFFFTIRLRVVSAEDDYKMDVGSSESLGLPGLPILASPRSLLSQPLSSRRHGGTAEEEVKTLPPPATAAAAQEGGGGGRGDRSGSSSSVGPIVLQTAVVPGAGPGTQEMPSRSLQTPVQHSRSAAYGTPITRLRTSDSRSRVRAWLQEMRFLDSEVREHGVPPLPKQPQQPQQHQQQEQKQPLEESCSVSRRRSKLALPRGWRVLVVDDASVNQQVLKRKLCDVPPFRELQWTCQVMSRGDEAVELIRDLNKQFDLIVLDQNLSPGDLTGTQIADIVREYEVEMERPDPALIVLSTGVSDRALSSRMLKQHRIDAVWTKPTPTSEQLYRSLVAAHYSRLDNDDTTYNSHGGDDNILSQPGTPLIGGDQKRHTVPLPDAAAGGRMRGVDAAQLPGAVLSLTSTPAPGGSSSADDLVKK